MCVFKIAQAGGIFWFRLFSLSIAVPWTTWLGRPTIGLENP